VINLSTSTFLIHHFRYPISDVGKIISTREARHALAMKQNDHLEIMRRIEEGLVQIHANAKKEGKVTSVEKEKNTSSSSTQSQVYYKVVTFCV